MCKSMQGEQKLVRLRKSELVTGETESTHEMSMRITYLNQNEGKPWSGWRRKQRRKRVSPTMVANICLNRLPPAFGCPRGDMCSLLFNKQRTTSLYSSRRVMNLTPGHTYIHLVVFFFFFCRRLLESVQLVLHDFRTFSGVQFLAERKSRVNASNRSHIRGAFDFRFYAERESTSKA